MFRCYSYTVINERISLSTAEQFNTHTDTNKDPIYAATPPPY